MHSAARHCCKVVSATLTSQFLMASFSCSFISLLLVLRPGAWRRFTLCARAHRLVLTFFFPQDDPASPRRIKSSHKCSRVSLASRYATMLVRRKYANYARQYPSEPTLSLVPRCHVRHARAATQRRMFKSIHSLHSHSKACAAFFPAS